MQLVSLSYPRLHIPILSFSSDPLPPSLSSFYSVPPNSNLNPSPFLLPLLSLLTCLPLLSPSYYSLFSSPLDSSSSHLFTPTSSSFSFSNLFSHSPHPSFSPSPYFSTPPHHSVISHTKYYILYTEEVCVCVCVSVADALYTLASRGAALCGGL